MTLSLSQTLLTGVYRSGSEFFGQVISGHPELASRMYNIDVMRWAWRQYDPIEDPENLRRAINDIAARNRIRYDFLIDTEHMFEACRQRGKISYGVLYDVLMTELFCSAGRRHWCEKCQLLWREIPSFLEEAPNGRAILLVRDPRSVLASFKKFTFVPPPAYLGAIFNCFDAFTYGLRYRQSLPPDRFLLVRYEDVLVDSVAAAQGVYRFLGLDPSKASHDPSRWGQDGVPWRVNSAFQSASEVFDARRSIMRWKEALDDWEIAFAETVCGETMQALGYRPTGMAFDWRVGLTQFVDNEQIRNWFADWLIRGTGVQSYPLDPRNVENWSETRENSSPQRHEEDKPKRLRVVAGTDERFPVVESPSQ